MVERCGSNFVLGSIVVHEKTWKVQYVSTFVTKLTQSSIDRKKRTLWIGMNKLLFEQHRRPKIINSSADVNYEWYCSFRDKGTIWKYKENMKGLLFCSKTINFCLCQFLCMPPLPLCILDHQPTVATILSPTLYFYWISHPSGML